MTEKIHFYGPATNDYISPTRLRSVARITVNDDGARWVEAQWVGSGDFQGMALYTSILDASIAAEVLNLCASHSEWNVYPQPLDFIKEHARLAVSSATVTTTPVVSAASQYCVSRYSVEKQMWIVASLAVNGTKPANKLH